MKKIVTFCKDIYFLVVFVIESISLLRHKAKEEETFKNANS